MSQGAAASIRSRLKSRSEELGLDLQTAIQYYAIERFLYRLSRSRWADRFVVKGATMLRVWDGAIARPTRDVDLLGRVPNSPDGIRAIIAECLAIESDDGIVFSEAIEATAITFEDRYPGVRVKGSGSLAGARFVLWLDIGIDDATVPEPGWVDFPTLLDVPAPRILAYQPETAIAEKVETVVSKGTANSRLKDYYDVWMLSRAKEFDGRALRAAFAATFERRGTRVPTGTPDGLGPQFTEDPASRRGWQTFRSKLVSAGIEGPEDLGELVAEIAAFVMPPLAAVAEGEEFNQVWTEELGWRAE